MWSVIVSTESIRSSVQFKDFISLSAPKYSTFSCKIDSDEYGVNREMMSRGNYPLAEGNES